jgi:hypothetical protein
MAPVMGTIYIGGMQLRYDVSGGTVVQFSDGTQVCLVPDFSDASIYVQAAGMGYGRQIGALTRDRVLMHCLIAEVEGQAEPRYLAGGVWPWVNRVDMLVCMLNHVPCVQQAYGPDFVVLDWARQLTRPELGAVDG